MSLRLTMYRVSWLSVSKYEVRILTVMLTKEKDMAHFASESKSVYFENQCSTCLLPSIPYNIPNNPYCPIRFVQEVYNYDQVDRKQKKLRAALNILISEDGTCKMKQLIDKENITKRCT